MTKQTRCGFCKRNGEVPKFYMSHSLKQCPVLNDYTCPNCLTKGSHTASYCPVKKTELELSEHLEPLYKPRTLDLKVPPISEPSGLLSEEQFRKLMFELNLMFPEARAPFILRQGYNPARLDLIKQIAMNAECVILWACF